MILPVILLAGRLSTGPKNLGQIRGQPYTRYTTEDPQGRKVTFYVSEEQKDHALPLVLYIQGSGYESHFVERGGRIISETGQSPILDVFRGAARIVIVEKPGVQYLDAQKDPRPEFNRDFTLDNWARTLESALSAARTLPNVKSEPCLIIGHSEGGLVACRVAREDKGVTHAAILAGGGPSILFDFLTLARKGTLIRGLSGVEGEQTVRDSWKAILKEPDRIDRFFLGFTYRKWFSFLTTSPIEELSRFKGRVFIGEGVDDTAMTVESADALDASLLSLGKDVTYERWAHADHSFHLSDQPQVDGWSKMMEAIRTWFLGATPTSPRSGRP